MDSFFFVAELIDGCTFDVVLHKIGQSVFGRPAIHQAHDVRMIERRQRLPFDDEPPYQFRFSRAGADQLHGNSFAKGIGALGGINFTHAAFADPFQQTVVAD